MLLQKGKTDLSGGHWREKGLIIVCFHNDFKVGSSILRAQVVASTCPHGVFALGYPVI